MPTLTMLLRVDYTVANPARLLQGLRDRLDLLQHGRKFSPDPDRPTKIEMLDLPSWADYAYLETAEAVTAKMLYPLEFSSSQWKEIESLGFAGFSPAAGCPLFRVQWLALANMALGKAARIRDGSYGEPLGNEDENQRWAAELEAIAKSICAKFQPGDGQL